MAYQICKSSVVGANLRQFLPNDFPNVLGAEILMSKKVEELACCSITFDEFTSLVTQFPEKGQSILFYLSL